MTIPADTSVKSLEFSLRDWRLVLCYVDDLLVWKETFYPLCLLTSVSFFHVILWAVQPSVLAFVASLGLLLTFVDFLLPMITEWAIANGKYPQSREVQYREVCASLIHNKEVLSELFKKAITMRTEQPQKFVLISVGFFGSLVWFGTFFSTLFLSYILFSIMIFLPGIQKHDVIPKYYNYFRYKTGLIKPKKC